MAKPAKDRICLSHSYLNTIDMKRQFEIYGSFMNVFSERQIKRNNGIRRFEFVGYLSKKKDKRQMNTCGTVKPEWKTRISWNCTLYITQDTAQITDWGVRRNVNRALDRRQRVSVQWHDDSIIHRSTLLLCAD